MSLLIEKYNIDRSAQYLEEDLNSHIDFFIKISICHRLYCNADMSPILCTFYFVHIPTNVQ